MESKYYPAKRELTIRTEYNDFVFTTSLQGFVNFQKNTGKDLLEIVSNMEEEVKIEYLIDILYSFAKTDETFEEFCEKLEISELQEVLKILLPYIIKAEPTEEAKKK